MSTFLVLFLSCKGRLSPVVQKRINERGGGADEGCLIIGCMTGQQDASDAPTRVYPKDSNTRPDNLLGFYAYKAGLAEMPPGALVLSKDGPRARAAALAVC